MPTTRSCSICGFARTRMVGLIPQPDVQRYSLYMRIPVPKPSRTKTKRSLQRGMGGIDLCSDCWTRVAKINMRMK